MQRHKFTDFVQCPSTSAAKSYRQPIRFGMVSAAVSVDHLRALARNLTWSSENPSMLRHNAEHPREPWHRPQ